MQPATSVPPTYGGPQQLPPASHFTALADLGPPGMAALLDRAEAIKRQPPVDDLRDRLLGLLFLNPSLRTRASFEAAMHRGGGASTVLNAGGGSWAIEHREGAVMDGDRPEHIREALAVLSRYVDVLGVRGFASATDDDGGDTDALMTTARAVSDVPVINMESAREHPCQGLADILTVREQLGSTAGQPVALVWAPHVKSLPKAVPHSLALSAAAAGSELRIAHPRGYDLHPAVLAEAREYAAATGGSVAITHDQREAVSGAKVVYAKSWGPASVGPAAPPQALRHWQVDDALLSLAAAEAMFMHCLPVRRNVEVADSVLDGPQSRVLDQAENRLHVQRALLAWLLGMTSGDGSND